MQIGFLMFAVAMLSGQEQSVSLHLICGGGGTAHDTRSTNAYASDSSGNSATATIVSRQDREFEDQVNIEIQNGEGRIRLPRTMLPAIHGGDNGWMRLSDIHETNEEITAHAVVNPISHPDVRIDRISGTVSISGRIGHFSGQCENYDPTTIERRF